MDHSAALEFSIDSDPKPRIRIIVFRSQQRIYPDCKPVPSPEGTKRKTRASPFRKPHREPRTSPAPMSRCAASTSPSARPPGQPANSPHAPGGRNGPTLHPRKSAAICRMCRSEPPRNQPSGQSIVSVACREPPHDAHRHKPPRSTPAPSGQNPAAGVMSSPALCPHPRSNHPGRVWRIETPQGTTAAERPWHRQDPPTHAIPPGPRSGAFDRRFAARHRSRQTPRTGPLARWKAPSNPADRRRPARRSTLHDHFARSPAALAVSCLIPNPPEVNGRHQPTDTIR